MGGISKGRGHCQKLDPIQGSPFDAGAFRVDLPSRRHSDQEFFLSPPHCFSKSVPNDDLDLESWYHPACVDFQPLHNHLNESLGGIDKKKKSTKKQRAELEQDVVHLQKQLRNEMDARLALENAMDRSSVTISPGHSLLTSETKELIDEIKFLEEEISNLEHHALSLYRGFFNRCLSPSPSFFCRRNESECQFSRERNASECQFSSDDRQQKQNGQPYQHLSTELKATLKQKQTSENQPTKVQSTATPATSPQVKSKHAPMLCETISIARHSQVSRSQYLGRAKNQKEISSKSNNKMVEEDGPRLLRDYLSGTSNQLSEDLVRCMAAIYCKLCDPPSSHSALPDSPSSFASSSTSLSSLHGIFSDGWSPGSRASSCHDPPLIDPFQVKGKHGRSNSYSFMLEIPWISLDKDRLNYAARLLRDFRSMVEQLEKVDPSQLKHDEKLAFWINIYNALFMHAYLAYGIPRNNLKRMTLLQRASYKVGGYSVNASTIEHNMLRCTSHRSSKWLSSFLLPSSKFKGSDDKRAYAIDKGDPLVCFALCCGGRSDPAVRVYTAKNVHEELECAMREFIQASVGFQNDRKVLLPKVIEWYAREASLSSSSLLDWVSQSLDIKERELIRRCILSKPNKSTSHCIEWVSYNFSFRYIIDRDAATRPYSR